MGSVTKTCVICKEPFEAKRSDAEVCSPACRQKHWRNKKEKATKSNTPNPDTAYELSQREVASLTDEIDVLKKENISLKEQIAILAESKKEDTPPTFANDVERMVYESTVNQLKKNKK